MTTLFDRALRGLSEQRGFAPLDINEWAKWFQFGGLAYQNLGINQTQPGQKMEMPDGSFEALIQAGYKSNGVVFACELARQLLFTEARFQWQQMRDGRPGELFGTRELDVFENPWPYGTTGDLLNRMLIDADFAGTAYVTRRAGPKLKRLRPDWVTIVMGSENSAKDIEDGWDPDAEIIGFIYHPGGPLKATSAEIFLAGEVAMFAPIPDPLAIYRGMPWMEPVIREVMGDQAATNHKLKFFENGATPNLVVSLDPAVKMENFRDWIKLFRERHEGARNAYKTLYLGAGAKVDVVGKDLQQIDFKSTQGAGETRIAAAAGVPPVIVGLSEGLSAATYSNYSQARRRYADLTMRPLWRNAAGSLSTLVRKPRDGVRLWYDDRDIPFLADDLKEAAETRARNAEAMGRLVEAGYTPDSVVEAITSGDLTRLKHSGLVSVQLLPPGTTANDQAGAQAGRALAALIAPHLGGSK